MLGDTCVCVWVCVWWGGGGVHCMCVGVRECVWGVYMCVWGGVHVCVGVDCGGGGGCRGADVGGVYMCVWCTCVCVCVWGGYVWLRGVHVCGGCPYVCSVHVCACMGVCMCTRILSVSQVSVYAYTGIWGGWGLCVCVCGYLYACVCRHARS